MKRQSSELHEFLKGQAEGKVDSAGHFTLISEKAWEKLGKFQLPLREGWILKLVQAATAAGAESVRLEQSRGETTVRVHGVSWPWTQVEPAIFSVEILPPRPLQHLAAAIRNLASLADRPFSLGWAEGDRAIWMGDRFQHVKGRRSSADFTFSVAHSQYGHSQFLLSADHDRALRVAAEVSKVVARNAHLGRYPLVLDGRVLAGFVNDPVFGMRALRQPLAFLTTPVLEDAPELSFAAQEHWREAIFDGRRVFLDPASFTWTGRGFAAVIVTLFLDRRHGALVPGKGETSVIWVSDGVVVEREHLFKSGELGLGLVVSADGLETDLTGLRTRDTPAKGVRRTRALRAIHQSLVELLEKLSEGISVKEDRAGLAFTTLAGLVCLLPVPPLGLTLLAKAGYDYLRGDTVAAEIDQVLDQSLSKVVERLGRYCGQLE